MSEVLENVKILELLRKARSKFEDDNSWCQEHLSVDETGNPVEPTNPRACQWCTIGALEAVSPNPHLTCEAIEILEEQIHQFGALDVWNDEPHRNINEIRRVFDQAITELSPATA